VIYYVAEVTEKRIRRGAFWAVSVRVRKNTFRMKEHNCNQRSLTWTPVTDFVPYRLEKNCS